MHTISDEISRMVAQEPRLAALHATLRNQAETADMLADIPPGFFGGIDVQWLNTIGLESESGNGTSASCLQRCRLFEAFGHADPALSVAMPGPSLTLSVIKNLASPFQRRQMCDALQCTNPTWGAFALTEPASGSNAANMSLLASPTEGGYLLNGRKCYIGNAGRARFLVTFATVAPSKGQFGIRAFLIWLPKSGVEVDDTQTMLGLRALRASHINFSNCFVADESVLGFGTSFDPARSFGHALKSFDVMRPGLASLIVGATCGAVDHLMSGGTGSRSLQARMEALAADFTGPIQSARLLCRHAAMCVDSGSDASIVGSICKTHATELACALIDRVLLLPNISSHPSFQVFTRLHRDFQAFRMMEGTRDIHHLMIARERNGHHMKLEAQLQAARTGRALAA